MDILYQKGEEVLTSDEQKLYKNTIEEFKQFINNNNYDIAEGDKYIIGDQIIKFISNLEVDFYTLMPEETQEEQDMMIKLVTQPQNKNIMLLLLEMLLVMDVNKGKRGNCFEVIKYMFNMMKNKQELIDECKSINNERLVTQKEKNIGIIQSYVNFSRGL